MKPYGWLILGITLGATGCVEVPFLGGPQEKSVVPRAIAPAAPPALVSPEQITEANAAEKAEALGRELEWDIEQLTRPAAGSGDLDLP